MKKIIAFREPLKRADGKIFAKNGKLYIKTPGKEMFLVCSLEKIKK